MNNRFIIKSYDYLPNEAKEIREKVFVYEQGFNEEFDTVDNYAIHFLAYSADGIPVGTCRMFFKGNRDIYYLGRLAVLKEFRCYGIGSLLISECERVARRSNVGEIRLHSQCRAKDFYRKCGYSEFGEVEDEEGCPHIWMKKNIGEN